MNMIGTSDRFEALVEKSPDAILLLQAQGEVVYANASTSKVLGYQPEELLGRNGLDLIHPQDRRDSFRSLQDVLVKPEAPNRMQARVRQKGGAWLWVETTAFNLLAEPMVSAIVVNYRDIARRRAVEEERQRQIDDLIRANAELKVFAHAVAHDLREPLRTISAFTELLVRKAQLKDADQELAHFIVDGARRMSILLDTLLDSAEGKLASNNAPVDLADAVGQAMRNLSDALTKSGAAVTIDALPKVHGNEVDFVRLFQNLLSNAVKYRSIRDLEIGVSAERVGPDWVIRVRDNGLGIPVEDQNRVFGFFTRLQQDVPGTGLGLALCKKIVEGYGGAIWVESEPGVGSTFCFTVSAMVEKGERRSNSGSRLSSSRK
jgi:PAS domain S-box-containing protein